MKNKEILIVEISGKRPGNKEARPTEKIKTKYDHLIISNNSEGYDTEWDIVNVPDDYKEWYVNNVKCSENAWYAPMNRSYAIKYAREHGYKYLVQLDDNIKMLEISYIKKKSTKISRFYCQNVGYKFPQMFDDFIDMQKTVLDNTNAVMVGLSMASVGVPDDTYLSERYCYSFFMLDLEQCPDIFQGDFEDDIEYRLKCAQMGLPVVQIAPLKYGKVGQDKNKDLSGCRAEYARAGLKRGEHMSILYGDIYHAKMSRKGHSIKAKDDGEAVNFKHIIKPFKVGIIVKDKDLIDRKMTALFEKYSATEGYGYKNKVIRKVRKVKA